MFTVTVFCPTPYAQYSQSPIIDWYELLLWYIHGYIQKLATISFPPKFLQNSEPNSK